MPFIAHAAIRTAERSAAACARRSGGGAAGSDAGARRHHRLESREGSRDVAAGEFFTGLFSTALEAGEIVSEIKIPAAPTSVFGRRRPFSPFAGAATCLAGVAARLEVDGRGVARRRASRCSVSAIVRCWLRRGAIEARSRPRKSSARPPRPSRDDIDPTSDIHATSKYRRHLAAVLTRRALEQALLSKELFT